MRNYLACVLSVLIAVPQYAHASDGDLDTTFGYGGRVTTDFGKSDFVEALVIQPDGKIVAAGQAARNFDPASGDFALTRYHIDGSLDMTFGVAGKVATDFSGRVDLIYAVSMQSDGKIVAAGSAISTFDSDFALARYNNDGSLDLTFGTAGKVTTKFSDLYDSINALVIQSDGKIVAAGLAAYDYDLGSGDFALARYNNDGSPDTTFGISGKVTTDFSGTLDYVSDLAILSDGRLVTAGQTLSNSADFALARYNNDGSPDMTFGISGMVTTDFSGLHDSANALAIQRDGKIIVAGMADDNLAVRSGDLALARYNSDGSLDVLFGALGRVITNLIDTKETVSDLAIQSDGRILAIGVGFYPNSIGAIARYDATGSLDMTFGANGNVTVPDMFISAMEIQADGKIVAAGYSRKPDNSTLLDFELVRFNNSDLPHRVQLRFDPAVVSPGGMVTATFSGADLTNETYFDIRFRVPDSNTDQVAVNWQIGTIATHGIPLDTAAGTWVVTGVRRHRDANDHTGDFIPVSALLIVARATAGKTQ
jgi:uncharacterized delta-60 repeat protein